MSVLIFGGNSDVNVANYLQNLLFSKSTNPLVSEFLVAVNLKLRRSFSNLPSATKSHLPPFSNLREFVNQYITYGSQNPVIDTVFLSIIQLADYIVFKETDSSPALQQRSIISVSYGLIAGVTAAILPRGTAGIELAAHAVQITLKLALYIDGYARSLSIPEPVQGLKNWSLDIIALKQTDVEVLIEDFIADSDLYEAHAPFISAIWPDFVTVSGPPSTLSQLKTKLSSMQITFDESRHSFGPGHASHFHKSICLDAFVDSNLLASHDFIKQEPQNLVLSIGGSATSMSGDSPHISPSLTRSSSNTRTTATSHRVLILSPRDGTPYRANSTKEIYYMAITDILNSCQDFVSLLAYHHDILQPSVDDYRTISFGPSDEREIATSALKEHFTRNYSKCFDWKDCALAASDMRDSQGRDRIAIVGMSGRFPGADDLDQLWRVISDGLDMHREIPLDRFDVATHYDPTGKGHNKSHTPFGCFIDNPGLFDPRFFNMSPREAVQTDPMQRLALITAYEALEMAGYVPNRTPSTQLDRVGTFYGQTSDDWREINAAQEIDTYFITGGVRAFGPGRINYHFGFSGPSFSVDTACSSSMAAIHAACNALWMHDCDTAITGGLNVMTNPDIFSGLSKGQFLSKVGPCQTFDNDADGYCRGDAVATIILKRVEDAKTDNDNILGVIRSVATNHSADAISITHPHAGTQEALYRRVLSHAGVKSQDISYVEMHGTGTQAGDNTEMRSVTNVFAPPGLRSSDQKLYVGSVKANLGHGEASSGITAIIKTLLMMRHNSIPPHIGIKKQLNKGFPDLDDRNVHISQQSVPWDPSFQGARKAFVNNFSAAGGNTAMVITDGISKPQRSIDPRDTHVVAVSARALSSLKTNINRLIEYLNKNPRMCLSNLSYTTTARRSHYNYRFSVAASSVELAKGALTRALESDILPVSKAPMVIMTFTGQGAMYPSVGSDLFETSEVYRNSLIEFDSICASCGFPSILSLVNGQERRPVTELSPVLVQLAQVSIQMALTRLWKSFGIVPDAVLGHSLGEYAALFSSSVISAADTIYLVGSRARLMEISCNIGTHAMLAVQGELPPGLMDAYQPHIACVNSGKEFVLSGFSSDMEKFQVQFEALGLKSTILAVPYAFHSSQVDAIMVPFRDICSRIAYQKPNCKFLSSTLGKWAENYSIDAAYLCRHARHTVDFHGALCDAKAKDIIQDDSIFLEIGPSSVCNGFVKSILGSSAITCASLRRQKASWDNLASGASQLSNKGAKVNWAEYHREFESSMKLLELPSYGWALSNYWIDYQNDWCLTKGSDTTSRQVSRNSSFQGTTSVHRVMKEDFTHSEKFVKAETDLSEPNIRSLLKGHMVNNVALCPSSLYGDIGMTIGTYMYKKMNTDSENGSIPGMNVRDMSVHKTLILHDVASQIISIDAKFSDSKGSIQISISSQQGEHASFVVEFCTESDWVDEWSRTGFLVESRMKSLREQDHGKSVHMLPQEVAYKIFSAFVNYSKPFQGMKKVYLDSVHCEATADVVLEASNPDQSFAVSPYWIDSIGHLSGFILNAQLCDHDPKNVYVSHGWESLRIAKVLVPGKTYRTYVRMMERPGRNLVSGDVYCMENSSVIAVFGGVTFMRLPRSVLDQVLPRPQSLISRTQKIPISEVTHVDKDDKIAAPKLDYTKKTSNTPSILGRVLTIIAEECGVDQSELVDVIGFADLGVDSLLQLAISSRLREELCLEIPSSLFVDNPTVGSLKSFIQSFAHSENSEDTKSAVSSTTASHCQHSPSSIVSVTDDTDIFTNDTEYWDKNDSQNQDHKENLSKDLFPERALANVSHSSSLPPPISNKHATSFLLQGNPRLATKKLFLFPDGGGSATSYTQIQDLSPEIAVYGLNSPFMTTPEEYTCGVSGIAKYFIQEIKRRQDKGPYNIGGWSAGGVIAFEGAQQLMRAGETVESLILIDAPCPLTIEPLPNTLHQWFNKIGLLGEGNVKETPPWLLPHFEASINALSTYEFRSLDFSKAPSTTIIWCRDGVCKYPDDPRPDPYPYGHAQFLLENKEDLGPQLWDTLVGASNIKIHCTPGNHFTMMKAPYVENLSNAMRQSFSSAT